jgi:DNA-binding CsgD family transcriptional regulator
VSVLGDAALPAAVVLGGSAAAHDAAVAALRAHRFPVEAADAALVRVLVDPTDADWDGPGAALPLVLVTTVNLDADAVLGAVLRGADAVVEADAPSTRLAHAVRVVAAGGTELSPALVRRVADALRAHAQKDEPTLAITPREHDILCCADRGESVKQTARTLGIAPKTVENLQSRLFRKLGVRNRAQAVALAHSLGLLPVAPQDQE